METKSTKIVGKIKINKQARPERNMPLTTKAFANLSTLINNKKLNLR